MPTSSARRSSAPSIANCAWLAPKPRNAPHTELLVRAAIASTSIAGRRYGPLAWPAARSSTFMPTDAYGPESPTMRARSAVSCPSASQPTSRSMRIGWRFGWSSSDSSRDSVHFTGASEQPGGERGLRLVAHVLLAAERAAVRHQLDGDALGVDAEHRRDLVAVVPHALAARVHVHAAVRPAGTASVDSGSRNACSMRWVWNTSCTTCALAAERGVDVAARVHRARQHVAVETPHRVLVGRRARRPDR